MHRNRLTAMACVLVLLLAGCSGASTGGAPQGGDAGLAATDAPEETAAADSKSVEEDGAAGGQSLQVNVQNRMIIRTARVTLEVEDFEAARTALERIARQRGGYVGDASMELHERDNQTWTTGTITLRVPTGNYSGALAAVKAQGEVESVDQQTDDVTDQVVDLRARLESLRAERERLRELYQQANDTEDVLAVQRELSQVQIQIERLEAKLRSLERRVAYSTITIRLHEPRPEADPLSGEHWYETPVTTAFLESVNGVIVLGRSLVVLSAYALPYALVVGVPLLALVLVVRREELVG